MPGSPLPLTALPQGATARVVRITGGYELLVYGFGIYPGVEVQLRQKYPSYVLKCEETEIALEADLAKQIWVEPMG
ncbi:MAG: ferrous iron transport protein A [Acidobacteria bacterium]|nr:ferrous iron transport protein A [Acidobacteriota bacterium]